MNKTGFKDINLATIQRDIFVSKANHSVSKKTLYLFARLIKEKMDNLLNDKADVINPAKK